MAQAKNLRFRSARPDDYLIESISIITRNWTVGSLRLTGRRQPAQNQSMHHNRRRHHRHPVSPYHHATLHALHGSSLGLPSMFDSGDPSHEPVRLSAENAEQYLVAAGYDSTYSLLS